MQHDEHSFEDFAGRVRIHIDGAKRERAAAELLDSMISSFEMKREDSLFRFVFLDNRADPIMPKAFLEIGDRRLDQSLVDFPAVSQVRSVAVSVGQIRDELRFEIGA